MRTCVRHAWDSRSVTSQGSPVARFERALATGDVLLVRAAALELPQVGLVDALRITLVILRGEPELYPRAASRWAGRLLLETRGLELDDAQGAIGVLQALAVGRDGSALAALEQILEEHRVPGRERLGRTARGS